MCGCAAVGYRRTCGDDHATAIGLQQIASKCSDVRMASRLTILSHPPFIPRINQRPPFDAATVLRALSLFPLTRALLMTSSHSKALRFHGGYSGLLVEFENIKNLSFLGGWRDPAVKSLLYGQSVSLVFYYLFENAAYLGWTAPGWIGAKLKPYGGADHLSRMSCFGWASWCLLDMASTGIKLQEVARMEKKVKRSWPHCSARTWLS